MSHDAAAHQSHHPALAHHFDSLAQQTEATTLGMWVFLVTEVLFFGGLFATYMIYRSWYPDAFAAASHELDVTLGTINTVVLITSSLTMALAVHAAQLGQRKLLMTFLILTMILGGIFLGIKSVEYYHKFTEHHVPGPGFQFEKEYFRHADFLLALLRHDGTARDSWSSASGSCYDAVVVERHDHGRSLKPNRDQRALGTSSTSSDLPVPALP